MWAGGPDAEQTATELPGLLDGAGAAEVPYLLCGVVDETTYVGALSDRLPQDLAVTIGRTDTGWKAGEAFYSLRVPLVGDVRLLYAPDVDRHETWIYGFTPDRAERLEALTAVVEAGGLAAPIE